MELPSLEALRAFSLIYRERNMTRAAAELSLSKAALTKRLHTLEESLGHRLFRRSTRKLVPTPEGERLYRSARKLLDAAAEFNAELRGREPMEGPVRLTCTRSLAHRFLSRMLIDWQRAHPAVSLDIVMTDSFLDLIENDIDLALRIGRLPESSLHGRRLALNRTVVCASPGYLRKHGAPRAVDELRAHPMAYLDVHASLRFSRSQTTLAALAPTRMITSNDARLITQLGLLGRAVIVRSLWDVRGYLARGRLVALLEDDPLEPNGDLWLLASAGRLKSKRVRALFDHLCAHAPAHLE